MATLSPVVWPGAIASFQMATTQVWDPSSSPPPLFMPSRLGTLLSVFLQLLDGALVLLYWNFILSPLTDVKSRDVLKMKAWLLSPITQQLKVISGLGCCAGD